MNKTNHGMETLIGNLLRVGVITAAAVVFSGGIIYMFRHGFESADYRVFQRVSFDWKTAFSFHGRGLIQLGLLLLIATPIARVALSIFAYARQRDTLYVIVTSIVFGILMFSLSGRF